MKLKVVGLPNGIKEFIAMVKVPKFYCESHVSGNEFEVDDQTGHQLVASYPGVYEVLAYGKSPKNKMASVDFASA